MPDFYDWYDSRDHRQSIWEGLKISAGLIQPTPGNTFTWEQLQQQVNSDENYNLPPDYIEGMEFNSLRSLLGLLRNKCYSYVDQKTTERSDDPLVKFLSNTYVSKRTTNKYIYTEGTPGKDSSMNAGEEGIELSFKCDTSSHAILKANEELSWEQLSSLFKDGKDACDEEYPQIEIGIKPCINVSDDQDASVDVDTKQIKLSLDRWFDIISKKISVPVRVKISEQLGVEPSGGNAFLTLESIVTAINKKTWGDETGAKIPGVFEFECTYLITAAQSGGAMVKMDGLTIDKLDSREESGKKLCKIIRKIHELPELKDEEEATEAAEARDDKKAEIELLIQEYTGDLRKSHYQDCAKRVLEQKESGFGQEWLYKIASRDPELLAIFPAEKRADSPAAKTCRNIVLILAAAAICVAIPMAAPALMAIHAVAVKVAISSVIGVLAVGGSALAIKELKSKPKSELNSTSTAPGLDS